MTSHPDGTFDRLRELMRSQLIERALPSLAVAVARDGVILWEEGFGWADRANRIHATPHTLYSLASISKPITTTGLMILQERGLLDLDRPIDDYLGDAKLTARVGSAADATVRRVANHTAGLPLHYQFFYADQPHRPPPFAETIRRYANLITMPGERHQYSNLGYGLLDHVISRLSCQSYADFMRSAVFLPLGMTHTSVGIEPELAPFQAIRYGADGISYPFYDFDHPGGSAVFCSAHDLVRFGMFHLKAHLPDQKAILSDQTIDTIWFKASGDIHAQIGDQLRTLVNQAKYDPQQQTLSGRMLGTIETTDARRRPHELQLDLKLRDQQLNGALYAVSSSDHGEGGAPERRRGNALGYGAELAKAA